MYDLVIVGGGLWGTAASWSAVEHRFGRVLLLERNTFVAGESSAKAGGIVSDFVAHPDDQAWVTESRTLFRQAQEISGDRTMIQENGMLSLCTPVQAEQLATQVQDLQRRNIPVDVWDSRAIGAHWPDLDRVSADMIGIWTPQDWHVNPTAAANAFLTLARVKGLEVRFNYRATTIAIESRRVLVHTSEESIEAARVLVTAGTWTRKLLQTAGIDIPFRPYRTQLASLEFPAGYQLPIVRELSTDMYFVPDGAHNLLVGDGTRLWEHDPDNYETLGDPDFHQDVASGVMRLISKGEYAQLRRSWAGLCGATPDRRPLVGKVADRLYIACGDNGFGIKRGPALGALAAKIAMDAAEAPQLNPHRYPPIDFPLRPGSGGTFDS